MTVSLPTSGSAAPTSRPVALILAAGGSTRMGGEVKALLRIGAETAVERLVRIAREAGFEPAVVVGAHARSVEGALSRQFVRMVFNDRWSEGRTGSIQAGLGGVAPGLAVLLWPVDHPFVQAKTLRRLREVADRDALGVWFIPSFQGQSGHPVLLRSPVLARILSLPPEFALRRLLPEFGPQVVRLEVADRGVTENVDTQESYHRLLSAWNGRGGDSWTGD